MVAVALDNALLCFGTGANFELLLHTRMHSSHPSWMSSAMDYSSVFVRIEVQSTGMPRD